MKVDDIDKARELRDRLSEMREMRAAYEKAGANAKLLAFIIVEKPSQFWGSNVGGAKEMTETKEFKQRWRLDDCPEMRDRLMARIDRDIASTIAALAKLGISEGDEPREP